MAKTTLKKIVCDNCNKKINARLKKKVVGELELTYLWCAKCKTVYPSYIHDRHTRENVVKMEKLQDQVFGPKRVILSDETPQEIKDMKVKENALLINEIRKLKQENVLMSKRLVVTHIHLYENIGDKVIHT